MRLICLGWMWILEDTDQNILAWIILFLSLSQEYLPGTKKFDLTFKYRLENAIC